MSFSPIIGFHAIRDSFLHDDELPFADVLSAEVIASVLENNDDNEGQPKTKVKDDQFYTPAVTLWAFLSQMLFAEEGRTCQTAVERVIAWFRSTGRPTPSDATGTYCRARFRLPLVGIAMLVRHLWADASQEIPEEWLWHERRVFLIDGTTFSMPDTRENQEEYPQPGTQKAGVGFPIMRAVVLICMVTGLVIDMATGKYKGKETGETALFRELMSALRPGDVVVADRYYAGWFTIALLDDRDVKMVTRLHQHRTADFRRGERLGCGDHIVEWTRPPQPDWMDDATYAEMPEVLRVREIKVIVSQKGFRTESFVLVTTLTNDQEFPMEDLASLYRKRWLVEIDIRALKGNLHLDVLRSKSPEMVRKELWTGVLAYNLIRQMILQAAIGSGQTPRDISFAVALEKVSANYQTILLCDERVRRNVAHGAIKDLAGHRVGHRPDRVEPRAIKRRPKSQKLLTEPRDVARARLGRVPDGTDVAHSPAAIAKAEQKMQADLVAEAV